MRDLPLHLEIAESCATLWLSRPERANSINARMVELLAEHLDTLQRAEAVRTLFIRGAGGKFCSGADLKELAAADATVSDELDMRLARLLDRLVMLPMALVAVMESFALGGGFLISLYCDWRIATPQAQLGFTPLARNWLPPWGLSRLASWLGPARARQFLVARGSVTAEEALTLGLVDQIVPAGDVEAALAELAQKWSGSRADVVGEAKQFYANWTGVAHAEWDRRSAAAFDRTFRHPIAREAIGDFIAQSKGNQRTTKR